MRHILVFAAIMSLLTIPARLKGADRYTVENRVSAFTVVNKVAKSTTCDCGITGKCYCYVGECSCAACGAAPAKKASPGMKAIGARPADTSLQPGKERGLSEGSLVPSTSINAPAVYQLGGTNCPNGQCPGTYTRGGFFRR